MTEEAEPEYKPSRASKQLGDFGEGLVTYTLIRKGFEVDCVDHVGAELIAERKGYRVAVSVKTRQYRHGSIESRGFVFEYSHLKKLEYFAKRFNLEPIIAHAVCIPDDKAFHLFMLRVVDIRTKLKAVKLGYRFQYGIDHLAQTIALPFVDCSSWSNESSTGGLCGMQGPEVLDS